MLDYACVCYFVLCNMIAGRTFRQHLQTSSCVRQCGYFVVVPGSFLPDRIKRMEWNR